MLTWEVSVEAHALRKRGWTISAIARHLGVSRVTVRAYLDGTRVPGQRARSVVDPFEVFAEYCRIRLCDDPHLWGTTLFDELIELGYAGSYPSFTRAVRVRTLRPVCAACAAVKGHDRGLIDHPAGEEVQWDWVELPDPPSGWGWGASAHLLVGALAHSSRWRGVLADSEDQPHLIEALDAVSRRLGGLPGQWRFDRMATVCDPGSGRILPSFGAVAVHYGVGVRVCPSRHAWRKGVVEKANHSAAQRWWRTVGDEASVAAAQASLDRLCTRLDGRRRVRGGARTTVGALADAEPLRPMPAVYPATLSGSRTVSAQALVAFRGNFYSVPPGHGGTVVDVRHRLGEATLDVVDPAGIILARHRREPDGAGMICRSAEHVRALSKAVLSAFTDQRPCRSKERRPPSAAALAEADRISRPAPMSGERVVVDFAAYAGAVRPLGAGRHSAERAEVTGEEGLL